MMTRDTIITSGKTWTSPSVTISADGVYDSNDKEASTRNKNATVLDSMTFILPAKSSINTLPANHAAWQAFDELMAMLDNLERVDDDIDDKWLGDLRGGSANRIEPYDDF